ncbi:helix-turn-helix transcriptional regulator [Aquirufa sp.]|jgi:predicted DNA-binding transcriptional regulator YafY|uniref:helix-turn-helix transcriptional regulator n=1 Tax=Aquirufa sp. TaxID=2676249 RepID=UPI0037C00A79
MHPSERLREINSLLLQKSFQVNYASISAYLSEQFDIANYAERSFSRDIKDLKELLQIRYPQLHDTAGELIKFSRAQNRFYLIRDDISAFPSISDKELSQIASTIEQNKHLFSGGAGEGLVNKLRAIALENSMARNHDMLAWSAIELVKDGERSGADLIPIILENIHAKKVVLFSHRGLSAQSKLKQTRGIPLMLKEYNNGWYTGWYVLFQAIEKDTTHIKIELEKLQLYALDRIVSVSSIQEQPRVRIHPEFRPADYFKNCLGLFRSNSQKAMNISCRMEKDSWMLNYIEKYPIHASQQISRENESSVLVQLTLEIDQEVENFFLRFAQEIRVIEPEKLAQAIKNGLEKGILNYC